MGHENLSWSILVLKIDNLPILPLIVNFVFEVCGTTPIGSPCSPLSMWTQQNPTSNMKCITLYIQTLINFTSSSVARLIDFYQIGKCISRPSVTPNVPQECRNAGVKQF